MGNDNTGVIAVLDMCIDAVNSKRSPEHAAWHKQLSEARGAVHGLVEVAKRAERRIDADLAIALRLAIADVEGVK